MGLKSILAKAQIRRSRKMWTANTNACFPDPTIMRSNKYILGIKDEQPENFKPPVKSNAYPLNETQLKAKTQAEKAS